MGPLTSLTLHFLGSESVSADAPQRELLTWASFLPMKGAGIKTGKVPIVCGG
jgi:hypothetical protein